MRRGTYLLGLVLALGFATLMVRAQEAPAGPPVQEMTDRQQAAIRKGLEWLKQTQNAAGLWGCEKGQPESTAISGLAVLAFLASGSTPADGPYAPAIQKAVDKMLRIQGRKGEIMRHDSTGMGIFYDHSCAVLALAEAYGMARSGDAAELQELRTKLDQAIAFIYEKQNGDGGFSAHGLRGQPSDLGITATVWLALRAASNAGLTVRNADIKRVEEFAVKCAERNGGFASHPAQSRGGSRMFYPTSAGLRILYGMGRQDMQEVVRGTEVLLAKILQNPKMGQDYGGSISEWDYAAAFYAVQALMHENGKAWRKWYPLMRDFLIQIQNGDGSWTIQYCTSCRAYATALSLLVLQAPRRALPMFQM